MRSQTAFRAVLPVPTCLLGILIFALAPAFARDDYENALEVAQKLIDGARFDEAIKVLKATEKLPNGETYNTYWSLLRAYVGVGATKNALQTGERALSLAPDDVSKARVHNMKGRAYLEDENNSRNKLPNAEAEFRTATQLAPSLAISHYNLGIALLREGRDAEGVAELKTYIGTAPNDTDVHNAKRLIDNPRRARDNYAPDFTFTSADGEYISSDDLRGKVILVDFWATWCPPCREATGEMAHIFKAHARDRFTLISVSVDRDAEAWRHFVEKNRQEWVEVRDTDGKLRHAFFSEGRISLPTYFVIDGDGIIRSYRSGWSNSQAVALEGDVKKWLKVLPPTLAPTPGFASLPSATLLSAASSATHSLPPN